MDWQVASIENSIVLTFAEGDGLMMSVEMLMV